MTKPVDPAPTHRAAPLLHGLLSLTGVQAIQVVLPLATLPYLTRVLGLAAWGEVAAALALGNLAAAIPEYGFAVTATRHLAQRGHEPGFAQNFVARVVRAKGLLAGVAVVAVLAVQPLGRAALASPMLVAGACLIAVGHGLWMAWYFEGAERAPVFLRVVAVARVAYVVALLAVVRGPAAAGWVPVLYGLSGLAAALLSLRVMPWRAEASARDVGRVLAENRQGFAQRLAVMSYVAGNVYWLSLLAPPEVVGGYGAAEQSVRAACLALVPISRALYPRFSRAAQDGYAPGWMRFTRTVMAALGLVLSLCVFAGAGLLPVVFGGALAPYVGIVRWLSPLPFLISVSQYSIVQVLLARGHDALVTRVLVAGALIDISGAFLLVPRYGANGMVAALLVAETTVALGSLYLDRRVTTRPVARSADG